MTANKPKRLTLVRHANAEQDADVRDFERPLSRKGQNEALEMARRFQERGLTPDLILVSAATRTRETAETFAKVLGVPARLLQADDALYLAEGDYILGAIRGVGPRVNHLMVIGHKPGICRKFGPPAPPYPVRLARLPPKFGPPGPPAPQIRSAWPIDVNN